MVHPNILCFEEGIRESPRERCAIFSENGEKIFEKESFIDNLREICSFNDSEFECIENKILSYNHPSGMLFSDDDISLTVDANLAELRVVTTKGTFSLKQTTISWPETTMIL